MHHPRCILIALLVLTSVLANGRAAAGERSLDGVNFTGPLITPIRPACRRATGTSNPTWCGSTAAISMTMAAIAAAARSTAVRGPR